MVRIAVVGTLVMFAALIVFHAPSPEQSLGVSIFFGLLAAIAVSTDEITDAIRSQRR